MKKFVCFSACLSENQSQTDSPRDLIFCIDMDLTAGSNTNYSRLFEVSEFYQMTKNIIFDKTNSDRDFFLCQRIIVKMLQSFNKGKNYWYNLA